jgi:hypothetical protein
MTTTVSAPKGALEYRVADLGLSEWGRKELTLAELAAFDDAADRLQRPEEGVSFGLDQLHRVPSLSNGLQRSSLAAPRVSRA